MEAFYKNPGVYSSHIFIPPKNVRTMATLCKRVLSQVIAYNGFRLPTLAYGQLTMGDIIKQRRDIN